MDVNTLLLLLSAVLSAFQTPPWWFKVPLDGPSWPVLIVGLGLFSQRFGFKRFRSGSVAITAAALYQAGIPEQWRTEVPRGSSLELVLFFSSLVVISGVYEFGQYLSFESAALASSVIWIYGSNAHTWVDEWLGYRDTGIKNLVFASSAASLWIVLQVYEKLRFTNLLVLAILSIHLFAMLQLLLSQVSIEQPRLLLASLPLIIWVGQAIKTPEAIPKFDALDHDELD